MKNSVVVFKDKHSERMFHCPTPNALYKMALFVLNERYTDGWYGEDEDYDAKPSPFDLSSFDLKSLPQPVQTCILREHAILEQQAKHWLEDKAQFWAIQEAIKTRNGKECWDILLKRSHRSTEYESIYVMEMES